MLFMAFFLRSTLRFRVIMVEARMKLLIFEGDHRRIGTDQNLKAQIRVEHVLPITPTL